MVRPLQCCRSPRGQRRPLVCGWRPGGGAGSTRPLEQLCIAGPVQLKPPLTVPRLSSARNSICRGSTNTSQQGQAGPRPRPEADGRWWAAQGTPTVIKAVPTHVTNSKGEVNPLLAASCRRQRTVPPPSEARQPSASLVPRPSAPLATFYHCRPINFMSP